MSFAPCVRLCLCEKTDQWHPQQVWRAKLWKAFQTETSCFSNIQASMNIVDKLPTDKIFDSILNTSHQVTAPWQWLETWYLQHSSSKGNTNTHTKNIYGKCTLILPTELCIIRMKTDFQSNIFMNRLVTVTLHRIYDQWPSKIKICICYNQSLDICVMRKQTMLIIFHGQQGHPNSHKIWHGRPDTTDMRINYNLVLGHASQYLHIVHWLLCWEVPVISSQTVDNHKSIPQLT